MASQRLREAVSEIRKVAKKDPVLGAEGAVRLTEKIWPALQHVDTSSGALGSAVNRTLDALISVIVNAPADEETRGKWLDRLWRAKTDDGVDYLGPIGDRWGEICGSPEVAGRWADELVSPLRSCWTRPKAGGYFHGDTACLSCLLAAGRHVELLELLELHRYSFWQHRRYGVEALVALGRKEEAIRYAEDSRRPDQPLSMIDQACEEILISSGRQEEAYLRYGLSAARGNSYIARFRSVAKRYPTKDKTQILSDLIATTPGKEGKWFATAKELELYELALELANRSYSDPKTLTRAARDYLDSAPEFALGSAMAALRWLSEEWGYEVTRTDVIEAYDRALEAASKLNKVADVTGEIQRFLGHNNRSSTVYVRQSLRSRLPAEFQMVDEV